MGYALNSKFADPNLPLLAANATGYRVLALNSPDGTNVTVTAANTTGYSLLAASSSALVWDANADDLVIDPNTTFTTAYANGTMFAGSWSGGETAWAIRDATGTKTFYLTGYTYMKLPAALVGLPDGQSVSVSGSSLQAGSEVLWLTFETDGESVSFLITSFNGPPSAGASGTTPTRTGAKTRARSGCPRCKSSCSI